MQISSNKPQSPPQKVKNIILRYSTPSQFDYSRDCEHPENLHLLRYFPKYYKTLRLKMTSQNPLLSKIKKIKKVKQIKSLRWPSKESPLKKNWLTLFGNNRRGIEEIPQIAPFDSSGLPIYSFWTELSLREARFFYNIRGHSLPVGSEEYSIPKTFRLPAGKTVFKYLKNMRWQKRLEIYVDKGNYDQVKWILGRLEKTKGFLPILKMLKIEIVFPGLNIQDLLANKTVFSHLRDLSFYFEFKKFDRNLDMIPQMCGNLRSLSISFERFFEESLGLPGFLLSLQGFSKLETLKLRWRHDAKEFLKYLKPPSSLKHLRLSFPAPNLIEGGLLNENEENNTLSRDINSYNNLVEHWKDLKELETLVCNFECESLESVHFMKVFVTMVLKKVLRLKELNCQLCFQEELSKNPPAYEPFFAEQVPHLYESLQKFRARLADWYFPLLPVAFDLKMLKPFKNLKRIKLTGDQISYVNVEQAIEVLENNQKEGVLPKLSLSGMMIQSKDELREMLERNSKAKKSEKNLKIKLNLNFYIIDKPSKTQDLDGFCHVINSIKPIKGLWLRLFFNECPDANLDEMRKIVEKYPEVHNCIIQLSTLAELFCYVKMKGTKEQLFLRD